MENKEVYFEIILPKSSYLNYRLGITKIVAPNETALQAWSKACEEAEEWHKQKHPELYRHNEVALSVQETEDVLAMKECKTAAELGAKFKTRLTKNTQPYYMDILKTLTNNFSTNGVQ
jgi:hypothetical protein